MADVLVAGLVLAAFGAWRRWGRFRGEKADVVRAHSRFLGHSMSAPAKDAIRCKSHHRLHL